MKELEKTNEVLTAMIDKLTKLITPKGNVSESIFSGERNIIPMADVQHIERHWVGNDERTRGNFIGVFVITKHTTWSQEMDTWMNNIYLDRSEADAFIKAWCMYRHELEKDTLLDL